ncbi:hypothetical protein NDU88_005888, partial [Pleurodeles waltl]
TAIPGRCVQWKMFESFKFAPQLICGPLTIKPTDCMYLSASSRCRGPLLNMTNLSTLPLTTLIPHLPPPYS